MRSDSTPPAELYVVARALNPHYRARIEKPEWSLATEARDWRRFVSLPIRDLWPRFSEETRLALFVNAEQTRLAFARKRVR